MSARSLTINQRLRKAKSSAVRQEIAQDWTRNWHQDQRQAVELLLRAIAVQDWREAKFAADQLAGITEKRFSALPRVFAQVGEVLPPSGARADADDS